MTQEEIIEGNNRIHAFAPEITNKIQWGIPEHIAEKEGLRYHSSWDWLMPVVDKVEQLFEGSISVNIYDDRCTIEISTQYAMATDIHLPDEFYNNEGPKIRSTWLSIVQFIQWHNTQNP